MSSQARAQLLATTLGLVSDWRAHHPEAPTPGAATATQQAPQGRRAGGLAGVEPGSFLGLLLDARSKAPVAQPHASRGFGTAATKERTTAPAESGARLSDLVIVSQVRPPPPSPQRFRSACASTRARSSRRSVGGLVGTRAPRRAPPCRA